MFLRYVLLWYYRINNFSRLNYSHSVFLNIANNHNLICTIGQHVWSAGYCLVSSSHFCLKKWVTLNSSIKISIIFFPDKQNLYIPLIFFFPPRPARAAPKHWVTVLPPQSCSTELEISKRSSGCLTASPTTAAKSEQTAAAILLTGEIRLVKILKKSECHCWQHFAVIGSAWFMLAWFWKTQMGSSEDLVWKP